MKKLVCAEMIRDGVLDGRYSITNGELHYEDQSEFDPGKAFTVELTDVEIREFEQRFEQAVTEEEMTGVDQWAEKKLREKLNTELAKRGYMPI